MSVTAGLVDLAVDVIDRLGLPGVFVLMALESMVAPVPSEGVMPFAGFLVADGRFSNLWVVTAVATLGSLVGSGLSYEIGKRWGRPFVLRWGRWFLLSEHDLAVSERFFRRFGTSAIFIARLVPVVRHLISIPAGAARMRRGPFFAATLVGSFLWNGFLAYLGFLLGQNWERVKAALEPVDLVIVVLLVLGLAWFVWLHARNLRRGRAARAPDPARAPERP